MRRLKASEDSMLGVIPPVGGAYNVTPDTFMNSDVTKDDYLKRQKQKTRPKKKKISVNEPKHDAAAHFLGLDQENTKEDLRWREGKGDSENTPSSTNQSGKMKGSPTHELFHGNTHTDAAWLSGRQFNQLTFANSASAHIYTMMEIKELFSLKAKEWDKHLQPSYNPEAYIYQKLAYLITQIMYFATDCIYNKKMSPKLIVTFVQSWLNNNPVMLQAIRRAGMKFNSDYSFSSFLIGLDQLRESFSSIREMDQVNGPSHKSQQGFY